MPPGQYTQEQIEVSTINGKLNLVYVDYDLMSTKTVFNSVSETPSCQKTETVSGKNALSTFSSSLPL